VCIVKPPQQPTTSQLSVGRPQDDIDSKISSKQQEVKNWEDKVKRKQKDAEASLKKATDELKALKEQKSRGQSHPPTPQAESVPLPFSLQPGNYTVLRGSVEVCTFTLTAPKN
jgi:hypothetical protein